MGGAELQGGVPELDRAAGVDGLVGPHRGGVLERREALLRPRMHDDSGPGIFKWLTAGDVVVDVSRSPWRLTRPSYLLGYPR
jgi:hypothetical protein